LEVSHAAWMSSAQDFKVVERLSICFAPADSELPEQTGAEMFPPAASERRWRTGLNTSCFPLFFPPMLDFLEILLSCFSKFCTLSLSSFRALTALSTHVVERQVFASAPFIRFSWFFLFLFFSTFFPLFFCLLSAFFLFFFFSLFFLPLPLLGLFFLLFLLRFCPLPPFLPFRPFFLFFL